MGTHQTPVAKIAIIMIFFLKGVCNFQIAIMKRIRIAKSDMTLNMPVAIYLACQSKQWPVVINLFQTLSCGLRKEIAKQYPRNRRESYSR
jgi:hypothetical protein